MKLSLPTLHRVHSAKHRPLHPLPVVYMHWEYLVTATGIALAAVIALAFYVYVSIQDTSFTPTASSDVMTPRTINRGRIEAVLTKYADKKAAFEQLKNEPPQFADPAR